MTDVEEILSEIRIFKLSNGDEVVSLASVSDESPDMIKLESPLLLNKIRSEGQYAFAFSSWNPLSKENVYYLNPDHVITHTEADDDIKENYVKFALKLKYADEMEDDDGQEYLDSIMNDDPDKTYH